MGCKSTCICCICCFAIFASPFVILSYVGVAPRFYITKLYIPALNHSQTFNASNLNSSIIIDFKFKRVVAYIPLRYQNLNIDLYYGSNRSFPVGHHVLPGFYQGRKKSVRRRAVVEALGLPWEDALQKVSAGSTVALTVELATRYQLKYCNEDSCDYTDGTTVVVAAEVRVDGSGVEVSKKAIRLH